MAEESITISFKNKSVGNDKTALRYPYNTLYTDYTDYVRFDIYKYNPPFQGNFDQPTGKDKDGDPLFTNKSLNYYNSSVNSLQPDKELSRPIFLYMPEDISATYAAEWTGKGFTNSAADLLKFAGQAAGKGNPIGTAQQVGDMIGRTTQRVASAGSQALVAAINNLPGGIGGDVTLPDVLGGVGGVILNPNTELMYGGFTLRAIDLKFKMTPRSDAEAKVIREICNTFKKASLPRYSTTPDDIWGKAISWITAGESGTEAQDQNSNYLGIPNLIGMKFMSGPNVNQYVAQFKPCAITKVDINYTPDGSYATYGGAGGSSEKSPVATELTLSLAETKLVYREDIADISGASY